LLNQNWVEQNFPDIGSVAALGHGGQKQVFSGVHTTDGDVVLKIIHPAVPMPSIDREVMAVEQVQSPRVPRILEVGTVATPFGNCIWIREQRVMGVSLRARLGASTLSPDELLRLTLQILEALAAAEGTNIVHRDVKPDNTMLDANGEFWLLDFGIARHLAMTPLTATAAPFGKFTVGYAPVEQFRNIQSSIDSRADLFALGVTVHECATGVQPFWDGARDQLEVLAKVEKQPLPPLVVACKQSDSFRDLIDAMTKKRRDQRVGSVSEALIWMREIVAAEGAI
jgi:eukaryotic-like serine/threonine-protein kinase